MATFDGTKVDTNSVKTVITQTEVKAEDDEREVKARGVKAKDVPPENGLDPKRSREELYYTSPLLEDY